MKTLPITFQAADDILDFIEIVSKFDCDVDLKIGSYLVDAKSLMGGLSLCSRKQLEIQIHSENCDEFISRIEHYIS